MAGTKKVYLRNTGNYALVDSEDFEKVNALSPWYENDQGYAVKKTRIKGKNISIRMHKLIMDTPKGLVTDHINGNRLDNRKNNLRCVSQAINSWNRQQPNHKKYDLPKGVSYDKNRDKYVASMTIRKRFNSLDEAIEFTKLSRKDIYAKGI